ncbi:CD83 antigen [Anguilla anguilla]|uniref:CD83 antigen n=1 Tax=Anguilla anguilla TaxID=7936 RepID=UPI0015B36D60|nr:CD83 antigen [Anguilla anguilla]
MMALLVLLVIFASGDGAASTLLEIQSSCGEDSVLKCGATPKPGVEYRAVRWQRVSEEPPYKASGMLSKTLRNNSAVQMYQGFARPAELLENSWDLLLPNVTAQDSGKYLCFLAAPVGEKNMEGYVFLNVTGCPMESAQNDVLFEVIVCVSLALALLMCFICWVCLKNISILKSKKKGSADQTLKAPLRKKNLNLIYTPGLNSLEPSSYHHVCV